MYEQLKDSVYKAIVELQKQKLVIYNWTNVSGIDRRAGVIAIKPAQVSYDLLTPEKMVIVDLDGRVVDSYLKPSSQTHTHLELYRKFNDIGGICHTHSMYATMWAQACCQIPCLGTTAADYFYGFVPVTENLTKAEIQNNYESNIGKAIVKTFEKINPTQMPAVLVASHGPFTWGPNPAKAVENTIALETTAKMAFGTVLLNDRQKPIPLELLQKHYMGKHGENAY